MKVYPITLPRNPAPFKREILFSWIRVALVEVVQLFTVFLVLLGIDALFGWILPSERTHHRFLDFVVFAGWLALVIALGIFQKAPNVGAPKRILAVRFVAMFAFWTVSMTLFDSWFPNASGKPSIISNAIGGLIFAGLMSWNRSQKSKSE